MSSWPVDANSAAESWRSSASFMSTQAMTER